MPTDSPTIRHFLQLFQVGAYGSRDEPVTTHWVWSVYEVVNDDVQWKSQELVSESLGAHYPDQAGHEQMQAKVRLRLNQDGDVEAVVLDDPPRRTVIE